MKTHTNNSFLVRECKLLNLHFFAHLQMQDLALPVHINAVVFTLKGNNCGPQIHTGETFTLCQLVGVIPVGQAPIL